MRGCFDVALALMMKATTDTTGVAAPLSFLALLLLLVLYYYLTAKMTHAIKLHKACVVMSPCFLAIRCGITTHVFDVFDSLWCSKFLSIHTRSRIHAAVQTDGYTYRHA